MTYKEAFDSSGYIKADWHQLVKYIEEIKGVTYTEALVSLVYIMADWHQIVKHLLPAITHCLVTLPGE